MESRLTSIPKPYTGPKPSSYLTPANPVHCHYTGSSEQNVQTVDVDAATCATATATKTISYICKETYLIYPNPVLTHKKGTLTTQVPSFCTNQPVRVLSNGAGNSIFDLSYPYFAHTTVECCIYCPEQYYDLVASASIKSGLDCECLVDTDGNYSGKSAFCPHGLEPRHLGSKPGNALPGPCRKPRAGYTADRCKEACRSSMNDKSAR